MSSVQPHFQLPDKRGTLAGKTTFTFFLGKQSAIIFSAIFLCLVSNFRAGQLARHFAP